MTWQTGPARLWAKPRAEEILRERFIAGDSFTEIAGLISKELCQPCSRSACIGKASRLGLARAHAVTMVNNARTKTRENLARNQPDGPGRTTTGFAAFNLARRVTSPNRPLPPAKPNDIAVAPRPWVTRAFGECAFVVAGSGADSMSCCNPAPKTETWSYCPAHLSIMRARPATPEQVAAAKRAREARAKNLRRAA